MWERNELVLFLEHVHRDGKLFAAWWMVRRWEIEKAIGLHAWDLEALEKLSVVLGRDVPASVPRERDGIGEGRDIVRLLNLLINRELVLSTGVLRSQRMLSRLCRAWLVLEVRFPPDERGWLRDMREYLTRAAEHLEIDLRGMGV